MHKYKVSVVVVTYNNMFPELKKTLDSVVSQKDIKFEIIIADDGSKENNSNLIKKYFNEIAFSDYKLVMNNENTGTVKNFISGLRVAESEYTKSISPGDYLVNNNVLNSWYKFMKTTGCQWSFSDAVYYERGKSEDVQLRVYAHPQILRPYLSNNTRLSRWNYVVLNDIALGCTMMGKTNLKLKYCEILEAWGVKLAEDNIYRIMMFNGIVGTYYPYPTVFYECKSGVSNNKSSYLNNIIQLDWNIVTSNIINSDTSDKYERKLIHALLRDKKPFSKLIIKGKISFWLKRKMNKRLSVCTSERQKGT